MMSWVIKESITVVIVNSHQDIHLRVNNKKGSLQCPNLNTNNWMRLSQIKKMRLVFENLCNNQQLFRVLMP